MATLEGRGGAIVGGMGGTMHSAKGGVPYFATPWIELGKLEEREKWQLLAVDLVEHSIVSELQELKYSLSEPLSRLPELKQNVASKVDQARTKIASLIGEYRKLLLVDGSTALEKKAMIQALQYQACCDYELESIRDTTEDFTETITEEFATDEKIPEKDA
eukprot:c21781_g1_i1 orf=143-625(+)